MDYRKEEKIFCRICHKPLDEREIEEDVGYASGFGFYHVSCQRQLEEDV